MLILYAQLGACSHAALYDFLVSLPMHLQQQIIAYKAGPEQQLRIVSKMLLLKAVQHYYPEHKGDIWAHYAKDANAKPVLAMPSLHFSTAHSAQLCVLSADIGNQNGIDVELIRPIPPTLYEDYLCEKEKNRLKNTPGKNVSFVETWTRKEAVLKAAGLGIHYPIRQINTAENTVTLKGKTYHLQNMDIHPLYKCTLAARKATAPTIRAISIV